MALRGLVDTNVLSLALRRKPTQLSTVEAIVVQSLESWLRDDAAGLIGPVRQEILSGIRDQRKFEQLRSSLDGLIEIELVSDDFDHAAKLFNALLDQGVVCEDTDSLLAACAIRRQVALFSLDQDLRHFQQFGLQLVTS